MHDTASLLIWQVHWKNIMDALCCYLGTVIELKMLREDVAYHISRRKTLKLGLLK